MNRFYVLFFMLLCALYDMLVLGYFCFVRSTILLLYCFTIFVTFYLFLFSFLSPNKCCNEISSVQ